MKIDKVVSTAIPASQLNQPTQYQAETKITSATVRPEITINKEFIVQANTQLEQLSDIDMDKVAAVKSALERGELSLDIQALSAAVMRFHTGHE
ncbi:flagellar biosynthesis anti-sigma factor FlgM [Vibrio sp. HA2012]|uniref:flagellar biosynthesis anti-sigma factor FlgM n=1 Tax=Vibrio sp. HA2012 TaxID=1971595 RepID=UPI000C2B7DB4|nr:flagellar biosynthesis anti-sigma factor FlgM [Vibrio sp. HA2012]PJC86409.1 flagellar biosynthesis anti-sigma factor FlgM [Vibrio sp. HA2012]